MNAFRWGIILFVAVVITGVLGFTGVVIDAVAGVAKLFFYLLSVFLIIALAAGLFFSRRVKTRFTTSDK